MYALGHIVFGYLAVRLCDRIFRKRTSTWLALTAGLIPDFDLYFTGFGLQHHTYTHSLILWLPLIPLVYYKRDYLPAYVGILQHFLLDNVLVGTIPILVPISSLTIGLDLGVPSIPDTLLETSALLVAAIIAYMNGDLKQMLSKKTATPLTLIPLLAMTTLTVIASNEFKVNLVSYAFSSTKLTAISLGHIILGTFLATSSFQAARAKFTS